jgi:REP element-mobilizing transposase RayT
MIRAYHVIFTAYGFWLPNDPRGSWSAVVRQWELRRFGPATKTQTRRSVAHQPHDPQERAQAKAALHHPPVSFTGKQAREIARAFADAADRSGYVIYACAILPEHVHLVLRRPGLRSEQMVRRLKQAATTRLRDAGLDPMHGQASPWARKCWSVYLNDPAAVKRAIDYVNANPQREGKPAQHWSFVSPFDG